MRNANISSQQAGMSLFVSLAAVIALSAMTAVIMARGSHTINLVAMAQRQHITTITRRSVVAVVRHMLANPTSIATDGTAFEIAILDQSERIAVQDIYGLPDINAASPELLARLLTASAPDVSAAALDRLRQSHQFQTPAAFLARLGIVGADAQALLQFLTVLSGRRRISPVAAPIALLERLSGTTGDRAQLIAVLPESFFETRSPILFQINFVAGADPL